jgi:hypothetical protein
MVEHKKTGDSGMKNNGKGNDAGSRSSGHNAGGGSHGGASNNASDRDRKKSGHGRWSDSTGTGMQSPREPPPCLNTKKCAGEKHYLSGCPHTGKDDAIVLLSEYNLKRDADKEKVNLKNLGNNRATDNNRVWPDRVSHGRESRRSRYWQTQALTTPLYRAVLLRTQGFVYSLKVEVLSEPIMLNMAIRGKGDKQTCSATEMLMSAVTITTPSGLLCMCGVRQIIVEEDMDHLLIGRPVLDEMGFVASQHLNSVRDKFHLHDFSHIGEELLDMGKQPLGALLKLLFKSADIPELIEDLPNMVTLTKKKT